ncbi:acyltransferase [Chamaesiphon sp. VAR_69_metabat_338]|uniref:acyltransferase n=1 Tax=Chamaesiphon sp. VAR_69_metabat_338 TaxID=2964704 RepID=UPI00286E0760|nr:acyltransferase [Chamaesiphon sp. VAR_69_metabat_338]
MERQPRLIGIDLFRGFAILAVAILHVVDGGSISSIAGWRQITDVALFAVPFFLALSFYLAIEKLYLSPQPYPVRTRLTRLLVPYLFWSVAYLLYKLLKYGVAGEGSKLANLFVDPLALICFGGAAFHLYFLPLIAVGTLQIKLLDLARFTSKSWQGLALFGLVSLLGYEILLRTGNEYQLDVGCAFKPLLTAVLPLGNSNPILRLVLAIVAWGLRCLPYICVAAILAHPQTRKFRLNLVERQPVVWVLLFVILNLVGDRFLPSAVYEVSRGYVALLAAIACSDRLKDNRFIKSFGVCSFGIYLIHLFAIEIFQSLAKRIDPDYLDRVQWSVLLLAAIASVAISWWVTSWLMKQQRWSRIMFG